jgi:hypothetical protein
MEFVTFCMLPYLIPMNQQSFGNNRSRNINEIQMPSFVVYNGKGNACVEVMRDTSECTACSSIGMGRVQTLLGAHVYYSETSLNGHPSYADISLLRTIF